MYYVHRGNHCKINTCSLTVTHRVINHEYFVINHYRLIYICRPARYIIRRKYPIITEKMKNIQPYIFFIEKMVEISIVIRWCIEWFTWGECHKRVGRRVHLWMFDTKNTKVSTIYQATACHWGSPWAMAWSDDECLALTDGEMTTLWKLNMYMVFKIWIWTNG